MTIYKEFLGLNYCIYDPILEDAGAEGGNTLGYSFSSPYKYSDPAVSNPNVAEITSHGNSRTMVLLNLHRNGPHGYPMWKQIRASENHLTRNQKRRNIFTYVSEPGTLLNSRQSRFGNIQSFTEPAVVDSYKPISLVGDVSVYNEKLNEFQNRSVELKTSFGNETAFFANSEVNDYYETIAETDENYEQLKELYLDGGLEDEGSPIDSFNMFVYKQCIYPKQQYAYLDDTRSRNYFVNTFWRSNRLDRTQLNVDNRFGTTVPSQSMWPLDAREDFQSRTMPLKLAGGSLTWDYIQFDIGGYEGTGTSKGDNSSKAPGVLQNRYSTFALGGYYKSPLGGNGEPSLLPKTILPSVAFDAYEHLTSSIEYSRLHTLKNLYSPMNPSGISFASSEITFDRESPSALSSDSDYYSNHTASIFNGRAEWDSPKQAGKQPFYDSYDLFSEETRPKAKSFSKVPEFRISNHVEFYLENGVTSELDDIFELSGAFDQNTKTSQQSFYQILSTSDFLKHFDLVKSDHKDLANENILTLKCKAIKKFLPYEGFYPAQRTVDLAEQFRNSYKDSVFVNSYDSVTWSNLSNIDPLGMKALMTPMFAPGILFNTIKSGVAVDFPIIFVDDLIVGDDDNLGTFDFYDDLERKFAAEIYETSGDLNNALIGKTSRANSSTRYTSTYSTRIPFEALVNPSAYLSNEELTLQEPHPYGLPEIKLQAIWDGGGDPLYVKMMNNFLAEVPDFFIDNSNFKTISSLEEQSPEFGNAISGSFYLARIKMKKSRNKPNKTMPSYGTKRLIPPQDMVNLDSNFSLYKNKTIRETMTMYSRPSAFGAPTAGDGGGKDNGGWYQRVGSTWGYNFPYTPPYYHGEAWCDLVFECNETRKWTVDEILSKVKEYPYYTRYWHSSFHDAIRDVSGYSGSTGITGDYQNYNSSSWANMLDKFIEKPIGTPVGSLIYNWRDATDFYSPSEFRYLTASAGGFAFGSLGPQSPLYVNLNAMQLKSSVNLFGKGTIKRVGNEETNESIEVASGDTVRGKTRWIIQPKFETPILNFNKYSNLNENDCTPPNFAKSQVPRGMWHQYGDLPKKNEGIYLQATDIDAAWLRGALGIPEGQTEIKSLIDLVGFSKEPVRLGEVAEVKEISEAVVAVPFIEKNGTRQFFSIPREDIDSCIGATKREVEPGTFVAGGRPKAGDSVYQMVKKMKKYVFPPSMDFVKYKEIDPFAMYVFEFKHNLSKQDLADIWQNLPPEIGTRMEEAEATISHELLAHELLGGGAVIKNGALDDNAEGNGIPSNIQWMIFKAKKRAKTNYFDKVVAKKGTTEDTSSQQLENAQGQTGDDLGVTYNWPYDFFSLVELVKIDAEVTFANIENDDKGQKTIKKVEKKDPLEVSKSKKVATGLNIARGKGKPKK
tara:strand:+ start:481 stop:4671 length:4191 start_codon:yes stop_codon:yes gene_type:complete